MRFKSRRMHDAAVDLSQCCKGNKHMIEHNTIIKYLNKSMLTLWWKCYSVLQQFINLHSIVDFIAKNNATVMALNIGRILVLYFWC